MLELLPYQIEGRDFLAARKRAYLADEMGLGKTPQAICAARKVGVDPDRVLVVCPASVCLNWKREWEKWWPGTQPYAAVSYAKLIRRWKPLLEIAFDLVILDEAHYVKTPGSKRTRAALRIASEAERTWLLSGTPMPNYPTELYAPIKVLWPEWPEKWDATTAAKWLDMFTEYTMTDWGPRPYRAKNVDRLRTALRSFMLRRRLQDVSLELPPLRGPHIYHLKPTAAFKRELERMAERDFPDGLPEFYDPTDEHLSRLRRWLGEWKAPRVARVIVDEMKDEQYQKIVVMAYHRKTLADLDAVFHSAGLPVCGFDGSASYAERQKAIDKFQEEGGRRIFLAQQGAAGQGINLTAGTEVVLVEPAWSPEDNFQAIKRIHRYGQMNACRARFFAAAGTLDEAIMEALANKTRMISEVIEGVD